MDATAPNLHLTTIDGLRNCLIATGQSNDDEIVLLSGGNANYVYRVTGTDSSTRIYKHAAPYSRSSKDFALDVRRMDYEAFILNFLSTVPPTSHTSGQTTITVQTPSLLSYDQPQKLLCIADGGTRNLKAAYDDPKLDLPAVGHALAHWLADLHHTSKPTSLTPSTPSSQTNTVDTPTTPHQQTHNNNPIALHLYRHSYDNLHLALQDFSHDPQLGKTINTQFGTLLATDNECICHGDFWPGNILLHTGPAPHAAATKLELSIVDWELVRRGTSATDVGQFAAEAWLHDRFRGGRGLLRAFLEAYAGRRGGVGAGWVRRMVVHWAVHVAFWPTRVEWADLEGTRVVVGMGVEVLKAVLEGDWERIFGTGLLGGVGDVLRGMVV